MADQRIDLLTRIERVEYHLAERILSFLDPESLYNASRASENWSNIIRRGRIWKKLVEKKVASDPVWAYVVERKRLLQTGLCDSSHEEIYPTIAAGIRDLDDRWKNGQCTRRAITPPHTDGIFATYNDDEVLVNDFYYEIPGPDCLRILSNEGTVCKQTFDRGGTGGIFNRQFDSRMVICSGNDGNIHIWDRNDPDGSGPCNTLKWFAQYSIKFSSNILVAYLRNFHPNWESHLFVWQIVSPRDVRFLESLELGGGYPVNVDLDDKFIVMGVSRGPIRIWDAKTLSPKQTIIWHDHLKTCKYRDGLVAAGYTREIRIWDAERGRCLRAIDHVGSPCLMRLNQKRLIYLEGMQLHVWDLKAVLDEKVSLSRWRNLTKLGVHYLNPMLDMRFSDVQIECFFLDGTMLILDFRDTNPEEPASVWQWFKGLFNRWGNGQRVSSNMILHSQ